MSTAKSAKSTAKATKSVESIDKYIIVLPCEGSPYVWKNAPITEKGLYKELRKVVRGGIEMIDPTMMRIHPMFENRWRIADVLRQSKDVEIYANEDGMNSCTANMACLRLIRDIPFGKSITREEYMSAPLKAHRMPYLGEIALVVPEKTMKAIMKDKFDSVIDIQSLFLVRVADYYAEMGIDRETPAYTDKGYEVALEGYAFEPEDNRETKKFITFAEAKGWGLDSWGRVYMKKTGRPDEKCTDYDSESDSEEEEEEDPWMDVYYNGDFAPFCGEQTQLETYKDFHYYQCWGGGPEGGYITNDKNDTFKVNRHWCTSFTVERVEGIIESCGDKIRIIKREEEEKKDE